MVTPALDGARSTTSRHEGNDMTSTRFFGTAAFGVLLALASACGGTELDTAQSERATSNARQALSSGESCDGAGAHEKHLNLFACVTCHPTGATFGFHVPYTFAGGTTTAGGTLVLATATTPTTCAVACHYPNGAPAKSVAWDTQGPLACSDCHAASALPDDHPALSANATRED
jgi:hypothetical protein